MARDKGPIIDVTSYVLLATALLAVAAKITAKYTLIHRFEIDDLYMVLSLLCAFGYGVALSFQVRAGLGAYIDTTDSNAETEFGKAEYALDILYVTSLGFAKWTVLQYMSTLARTRRDRIIPQIVTWMNILKTIAAIFALAFQCSLPQPWNLLGGRCFNRVAFWTAFGCLDIFVDLATIAVPIYLIHQLQMLSRLRWKAITAFSLRIFVIPIAITRLVFVNLYGHSHDRPHIDYAVSVTTSVHIVVSIHTSCIPFLKKIFQNLSLGMYGPTLPNKYAIPPPRQRANKEPPRQEMEMQSHGSSIP